MAKIVIELVECEENIILAIVGNKSDKFEEAVISEEDGQKFSISKRRFKRYFFYLIHF